ncbi:ABC transporter permease [Chitinophaga sp. S165]|uniref:ABC transporter permease n=1 Tax=Chitinophaga sp. S165 TaxID=2135462 RepID=UPI000D714145|nr:ABC transporter permease [Chitinophaga sp. S165]PWV46600.1 FtsX-like permease family protein [Chitinophaga sp. S165]
MFLNYIKTAFRNFLRNGSHFFVNITGLMVGFCAFLLIAVIVQYAKEFDSFHTKKDRIYRVLRASQGEASGGYGTGVPFPYAAALRKDYSQLEKVAAIYGDKDVQVTIPGTGAETGKKFKERKGTFFAEPEFFEMFDFKMLTGNAASAIREQNTALLTREFATRYFGDWKQAVGKHISVYGLHIMVTGILENPPANTDFPLGLVISYATLTQVGFDLNDWVGITDNYCFVLPRADYVADQLNGLLTGFVSRHVPPSHAGYKLLLRPLAEMHSDNRFETFSGRVFSKELATALSLIGLFLLIIACVNFINLSTANAINRAREVGVRKALGGNRQQLLIQFLGETGFTCFIAMAGAIILAAILLTPLNRLLDMKISLLVFSPASSIVFVVLLWVVVTILAGFYPALVLSGFSPMNALKSKIGIESIKGINLRRGLVVLQFVIAQVLIIGTLIVISQMNYFRNADMGFNKEAVITAGFPNDSINRLKLDYLRSELLHQHGVKDVSFSIFAPTGNNFWATDLRLSTNHTDVADMVVNMKPADTSFFNIYKFQLLAGRIYYASDTISEFVVNETLVKKAGFGSPEAAIGQRITIGGRTRPITGVVKDFHVSSLREPMAPVVMTTIKRSYRTANIKIETKNAKEVVTAMAGIWNKTFPDYVFEYSFIDQTVADYYKQEDQLAQLFKIFAGIAVFISCLGLYGLISFMAARRRKEIGIRKVLGANIRGIILLLSKEFLILIVVAFVIATPIAWYVMDKWLQQFSFGISIGAGFFIITLLASVGIAWLTIGHSAIKAAIANPVKSLRTE